MDLVTLLAVYAVGGAATTMDTQCLVQPNNAGNGLATEPNGTRDGHDDQQPTSAIDQWQPFIAEASRRFGVPAAWVRAVMRAESRGRTMLDGRPITSRAGAMGLMQVMPETYEEMRRAHGLGFDPHDPRDNILAGTAYLRAMYDRYGYPGLFAAYNAGPRRYGEYLHQGRPLPVETRAYLTTIVQIDPISLPPPSVASGTRLFFRLRTATDVSSNADQASPSSGLFVPLTTVPDGIDEGR